MTTVPPDQITDPLSAAPAYSPDLQNSPFPELEQGFPETIFILEDTATGKHLGALMDDGKIALQCFETAVAAEVKRKEAEERFVNMRHRVVAVTFDEAREIIKAKVPRQSVLWLFRLIDGVFYLIAEHHVRAAHEC